MSKALHLNLQNPLERKSSSPIRGKFILAFAAGLIFSLIVIWAAFVGILLLISNIQLSSIGSDLAALKKQSNENEALKARFVNVQAEIEQFSYYENGRVVRGNLFRLIALAVPEGITLTALEIPEPGAQGLLPKPGSKLPVLQGPTQTVEHVELRLTGVARNENDVFQLMDTLKGPAFTNDLIIVENPAATANKSPRILAFRQEASRSDDHRNVFFDVVYQIKPRRFVK